MCMSMLFLCTHYFDKFQDQKILWITLQFHAIYAQVYPEDEMGLFFGLAFQTGKKKPGKIRAFGGGGNALAYLPLAILSLASAISAEICATSGEFPGSTVSAVCQWPMATAYLPAW